MPEALRLQWTKCQGDVWCSLNTVNFDHPHFNNLHGVYVIWHGGSDARTVYVGQGNIRDRLRAHRTEPAIEKFSDKGLYVTWAQVDPSIIDGVERFLIDALKPIAGSRMPDALPFSVYLPWQ